MAENSQSTNVQWELEYRATQVVVACRDAGEPAARRRFLITNAKGMDSSLLTVRSYRDASNSGRSWSYVLLPGCAICIEVDTEGIALDALEGPAKGQLTLVD